MPMDPSAPQLATPMGPQSVSGSMGPQSALRASLAPVPTDWSGPSVRLRHTWLQTVQSDLAPLNIDLATAYHRAQNRGAWSVLVGTATSASHTMMTVMNIDNKMGKCRKFVQIVR